MSADNWRVCPYCLRKDHHEREKRIEKIAAEYGKIPLDQWHSKMKEVVDVPIKMKEQTLREDYEQGIDDAGRYYVSFRARCEACGTQFHYQREEETPFAKETKKGQPN